MAQNSYKPLALAAELASRLKQRGLAPTQTADVDGYPVVSIGPGTPGGQNVLIKVTTVIAPLARDALGNVANIYCPDVMQVIMEAGSSGLTVLTAPTLLPVLHDVMEFGTKVELWESANGTAPSTATLATASNKKAEVDSIKYPLQTTI